MGGTLEEQTVVALSLDWLLESLPVPHLVKIDVEGAEHEVLRGASRMLESCRPTLLCEVSAAKSEQMAGTLSAADYQLFDTDVPLRSARPLACAVWNTLAVPQEKLDRLLPFGRAFHQMAVT